MFSEKYHSVQLQSLVKKKVGIFKEESRIVGIKLCTLDKFDRKTLIAS
jgi:hypothetical protein